MAEQGTEGGSPSRHKADTLRRSPPGAALLSTLPAPDDAVVHVHTRAHGSLGTLSRRVLDLRIHQGDVAADDVFWIPGMSQWGEIRHHPELFSDLLPAAPGAAILDEPDEPPALVPAGGAHLPLDADALVPTDTEQDHAPTFTRDPDPLTVGSYTAETDADRQLDATFSTLMDATFDHRDAHEFSSCIDEVILGAIITVALDAGRNLTDISSDGTHHFLRFVDPCDASHVVLRLSHLTGNLTASRVQGHMASMVIGYGERMDRFAEIWAALGEHKPSGHVPPDAPGALFIDGDVASQYVYARVRLFLRIDDYVERDWSIDYDRLRDHIGACVRALRIHLHGRFS